MPDTNVYNTVQHTAVGMYCEIQWHPCLMLHSSLYHISHFNSLLCKKIHLGSCYTLHAFLSYLEIGFPWVEEIAQLLPLSSSKRTVHCAWDVYLAGSLIHASPYKFCLKNCTQTKCQTWLKNQYFATWEHYTCVNIAGALYQLGLTPNILHKRFWVPRHDAEWQSVSHMQAYILCAAALHTVPVLVSPNHMWKNYQVQPIWIDLLKQVIWKELDDLGIMVGFPVQTTSGVHPPSHSIGTWDSFPLV